MYVDTSVVVKLYIKEPDSEECEALVNGASLASSKLLVCEFKSALLSKVSRGIISEPMMKEAWAAFRSDVAQSKLQLVPITDPLVDEAAAIIETLSKKVPLRTLDALHLATYMGIHAGGLFTRDRKMFEAAALLDLSLIRPSQLGRLVP